MNAFIDPSNACLDLTQEQVTLRTELQGIADALLKGGFYFRLIMTDDILHMSDIRVRAKEGLSPNPDSKAKDNFFYGAALPDALQEAVDQIVRSHKKVLLDIVTTNKHLLDEMGITAAFDMGQKAFLIQFKNCGMGFYLSERVHTPRHQRPKRMTLAGVAHNAGIVPAAKPAVKTEPKAVKNSTSEGVKRAPKTAPAKRRKFTVIREVKN